MADGFRAIPKNQALLGSLLHVRSNPREYDDDVDIVGIGKRRLQILYKPPFVDGTLYEVRNLKNCWTAFRSTAPFGTGRVIGYDRLNVDSATLRGFVERLRGITFNLALDLSETAGRDGVFFQLTMYSDCFSEMRFTWIERPPGWTEVVDFYNVLCSVLDASGIDGGFW